MTGGGQATRAATARAGTVLLAALAAGCGGPAYHPDDVDLARLPADRAAVVRAARAVAAGATGYVRGGKGRDGGYDCSGFVEAVYLKLGLDVMQKNAGGNGIAKIHAWCKVHRLGPSFRKPLPGDLVFIDQSYDANGDGRIDGRDILSHAGFVESVRADGWIILLHAANEREGITRTPYQWTRSYKKRYGAIRGATFIPPAN